jgi:hypothetical protein
MRERMAQLQSSFGEERKGTKTQKGKNAFAIANLIAKWSQALLSLYFIV